MIFTDWAVPLFVFLIASVGTGLTLGYSRRAGLVDMPNQRSSHSVPVPKGGGVALIASVILGMSRLVYTSLPDKVPLFVIICAAVAALAVVGWLDDMAHVPAGKRLAVHILATCAIGLLVNMIHPLTGLLNVGWLAWWIFWTIASINIVNFMDGIDGMVASQGIVYGAFLFFLTQGDSLAGRYGAILAAACFGFLLWNWAPARIFMGDVGSGPLGFLFVLGGALALKAAHAAIVFLPLFPLFLDALITLVGRARRGERLTDAHRLHLYQRVANGGVGHARVTIAYATAAATGAVIGIAVSDASPRPMWLAIGAYVLAVSLLWVWGNTSVVVRDGAVADS